MIYKSAAGMIVLAALFFAVPVLAQVEEEIVGGSFQDDCSWLGDAYATRIELDSHLRITVEDQPVEVQKVYKTKEKWWMANGKQ